MSPESRRTTPTRVDARVSATSRLSTSRSELVKLERRNQARGGGASGTEIQGSGAATAVCTHAAGAGGATAVVPAVRTAGGPVSAAAKSASGSVVLRQEHERELEAGRDELRVWCIGHV
jgi:hypothetical protein